jgi:hypothetical protein
MAHAIKIEKDHLLIVEGKDEQNFFDALLKHLRITTIQILPIGGKDQFAEAIKSITKQSGFADVAAMGIVRDADNNPKGAFDSISGALRKVALKPPAKVRVFTEETPKIGILVLPPQPIGSNHNLEDVCLASVAEDTAMTCLDAYFACLVEQNIRPAENDIGKARLHAFLASRAIPDLRLGEAAQKGYWNWQHPIFEPIKMFLQQLAVP